MLALEEGGFCSSMAMFTQSCLRQLILGVYFIRTGGNVGVYRKPSWGLAYGDRKFAVVVFGIFASWDPAGKEGPSGPGGRASGNFFALLHLRRSLLC